MKSLVSAILIAIFAFFCLHTPTHAGVFSFLKDLLESNGETKIKNNANSQTMDLLQNTYRNISDNSSVGGIEITIVNQNALLPDSGPLGTMADIKNANQSDRISLYVVRDGDNLSQIAEMFGVSVNTIIWANDIKRGSLINPGQIIVILPVSGIQYTVKNGDTLENIAKNFHGNIDEIIQFNGLDTKNQLVAGDSIVIPNGEHATPSSAKSYGLPKNSAPSNLTYTGYYMRPIEGGIRSQGIHGYNAVDLANSCGTPVMVSASGDVIISRSYGWNAGAGKYIVINHNNGSQTLYAHLDQIIVSVGWHVVKGQIIGYVGASGNSTGCHLHFEIRSGIRNPF